MGLDMYLNAERFFWYDEEDLAKQVSNVFPELKERKVKKVIVEAIYWRKSNAIHKWFVDNIQEGKDDCGYYYVERNALIVLRDLILSAIQNKDGNKLPPQAGFFFGSTNVDQYYWQDLQYTVDAINKALEDFPKDKWEFQYHSSW